MHDNLFGTGHIAPRQRKRDQNENAKAYLKHLKPTVSFQMFMFVFAA